MGKWDRNTFFLVGALLLFIGIQFRLVERVTLNQTTTEVLAKYAAPEASQASEGIERFFPAVGPTLPRKVVQPPKWLGLAFMSVGAVLILQSWVMPKPGG